MQFKALALAGLAGTIAAESFEQLLDDALGLVQGESDEMARSVTQDDMGLINQYGCWCYFQSDHGSGRGAPVDGIDQLCKRLHDGYTCAIMDSKEQGDACVPWEISYNSALGSGLVLGMTIDTIRAECDAQNPVDNCANWTCKVEGYFVTQLVLFFTSGGLINHDMRHDNGFDLAGNCPTGTGVQSERACCDEYPLRFPYKTYGGARQCCVANTYDAALYSCCMPSGTIRVTC